MEKETELLEINEARHGKRSIRFPIGQTDVFSHHLSHKCQSFGPVKASKLSHFVLDLSKLNK